LTEFENQASEAQGQRICYTGGFIFLVRDQVIYYFKVEDDFDSADHD